MYEGPLYFYTFYSSLIILWDCEIYSFYSSFFLSLFRKLSDRECVVNSPEIQATILAYFFLVVKFHIYFSALNREGLIFY